jgi:hypothetical protein
MFISLRELATLGRVLHLDQKISFKVLIQRVSIISEHDFLHDLGCITLRDGLFRRSLSVQNGSFGPLRLRLPISAHVHVFDCFQFFMKILPQLLNLREL